PIPCSHGRRRGGTDCGARRTRWPARGRRHRSAGRLLGRRLGRADGPDRRRCPGQWASRRPPGGTSTPGHNRDVSQDPFEAARPRIRGLAYRMLGTFADADDVAQDTWLRWQAAGGARIANPEAWLVTVATRLCLDRLRSAAREREIYPGPWLPEPIVTD